MKVLEIISKFDGQALWHRLRSIATDFDLTWGNRPLPNRNGIWMGGPIKSRGGAKKTNDLLSLEDRIRLFQRRLTNELISLMDDHWVLIDEDGVAVYPRATAGMINHCTKEQVRARLSSLHMFRTYRKQAGTTLDKPEEEHWLEFFVGPKGDLDPWDD